MRLLPEFFRHPPDERRLLLRSALLLICARTGLHLFSYRSLDECLGYLNPRRPGGARFPAERLAWAVRAVRRHLPGQATCLPSALVLHTLLRREGYASRIEIGVSKNGAAGLHAHAWVECEGKVLLAGDGEQLEFVRLRTS